MDSDQSLSKTLGSQHQPSTFEERGTTVPFTTPALSCARVRADDRYNLVLLTPGFAGTQSVCVLPWKAIPELVTMTIHDRALHEAIEKTRAMSPDTMRQQALAVAATGLAGPDVKEFAMKATKDDAGYAQQIQAVLILFLLKSLEIDTSILVGLDLAGEDVLQRAKAALEKATTPLGVDLETLYDRMGFLAGALSGLGLPTFGDPGRLRVLLSNLRDFHRDMLNRAGRANVEAAGFFNFAAEVALITLVPADDTLLGIDQLLNDIPNVVRHWNARFPKILSGVTRLSWLLDGWDYVIGYARSADEWIGEELWTHLDILAKMLPIVPRDELAEKGEPVLRYAESVQRRRVTALQDWRTGALDQEMARRLESAKLAAIQ
jgi:hypothetical protein